MKNPTPLSVVHEAAGLWIRGLVRRQQPVKVSGYCEEVPNLHVARRFSESKRSFKRVDRVEKDWISDSKT